MRKMILVTLFILLTAGFASSLTISSVSIPSSVTQGSSFTISASLTASDVASTSVTLSGSPLDSELSCTPTGSQTVSTASGSGTASWSCTANTIGVYNNQLTISASGVDGSGTTKSDSTLTGTEVVAGAGSPALTINAVLSGESCTCCSGNWNVATIVVSNPGSADAESVDVTWDYHDYGSEAFPTFSCPAHLIGTLEAGGTRTISCTSTRTTYTGNRYIDLWVNGTGVSDFTGKMGAYVNVNTSCYTPPGSDPPAADGPSAPSPTWTIALSPSSATLDPGMSKTISVEIKNTGTLQVSGVTVTATSSCATITPESFPLGNVAGGASVSYSAKVRLSSSAATGSTCYVDFNAAPTSGSSRTTSFAVTVRGTTTTTTTTTTDTSGNETPSEPATREDALAEIEDLNITIAEVEATIEAARGSNANITDAFDKLNQAKDLMARANDALEDGDYDTAVSLVAQAEALLNEATAAATPAEKFRTASLSGAVSLVTRVIMALVALSAVLGAVYYVAPKLAKEIKTRTKGGFRFTPRDQGKQLDLLMTEIKDKVIKPTKPKTEPKKECVKETKKQVKKQTKKGKKKAK